MDTPAATTSVSVASVKKITAVHDITIENVAERRRNWLQFSGCYGEFTIAVPEKDSPPLKLRRDVCFHGNGSLNILLGHLKEEKLPIVATFHLMKSGTKVWSSSSKRTILTPDHLFDVIEKPELNSRMGELLDENGCLTIRLEISLLPCCLSASRNNGGNRKEAAYEGFIEENEEKKIQTDILESLCKDMASMRSNGAAFSDLNIICQDKSFPVHKAFLSARSEVKI